MPNDYSWFSYSKEKKKKGAMREIFHLTGNSLPAQRAELSKPSQALHTNYFRAFSMVLYTGFVHTSTADTCSLAALTPQLTVKSGDSFLERTAEASGV